MAERSRAGSGNRVTATADGGPSSRSINVARGKPCRQSSLSEWSRPGEAAAAVNGVFNGSFAFHTAFEEGPWWDVDLGEEMPLRAIVVHNRADGDVAIQRRASPLEILGAGAEGAFQPIARFEGYFGGARSRDPLVIHLPRNGAIGCWQRIRLGVPRHSALHLEQVEIFVNESDLQVVQLHRLLGVPLGTAVVRGDGAFRLTAPPGAPIDRLDALHVLSEGRLGNRLIALASACRFALQVGIRRIYHGGLKLSALLPVPAEVTLQGLTILDRAPDPADGEIVLTDNFFRSPFAGAVQTPYIHPGDQYRDILRPMVFPDGPDTGIDGELLIHIRSGDIFGTENIDTFYVQPPLAYYRLCIAHAMAQAPVSRITVIYEDRRNPCVDALEQHLRTLPVPHLMLSDSLAHDARRIADARRVIGGHGTFVPALAAQSPHLSAIYFFRLAFFPWFFDPARTAVFEIADLDGGFTQQGEWSNSEAQRELMLSFDGPLQVKLFSGPPPADDAA